jgi:hypothetical protein
MNFYQRLGVSQSATLEDIKKAYKRLSLEYHPDRNPSTEAKTTYLKIQTAYETLRNENKRASYDVSLNIGGWQEARADRGDQTQFAPVVCDACQKVTAQPRYVLYYHALSFIFIATLKPYQGIFCDSCLKRKLAKSTLITVFLGWWSIPWGPFYTLKALFNNFNKGTKPALANATLLWHQSRYFYQQGNQQLGYALQIQVEKFLDRLKQERLTPEERAYSETTAAKMKREMSQQATQVNEKYKTSTLINPWNAKFGPALFSLFLVITIVIGVAYTLNSEPDPQDRIVERELSGRSDLALQGQKTTAIASKPPELIPPPYGLNWPSTAGYVAGTPIESLGGYASVEINNKGGDSPMRLKLVDLNSGRRVRDIFMPAGSTFTINGLTQGTYDIRMQNLRSGTLSKTPEIQLQMTETTATNYQLTIYNVVNGNLKLEDISPAEF